MIDLKRLKNSIRTIPDFPKRGIMFRDLTTLMKDPGAFRISCQALFEKVPGFGNVDFMAGVESRGFVYASVLAEKLGCGLVLIRKPGKLPGDILSEEYELEYGKDRVEVHKDAVIGGKRYLVIDDLLATGGTADAACRLIEKGGGIVAGCLFLVELQDLQGRKKLNGRTVISLIGFKGE